MRLYNVHPLASQELRELQHCVGPDPGAGSDTRAAKRIVPLQADRQITPFKSMVPPSRKDTDMGCDEDLISDLRQINVTVRANPDVGTDPRPNLADRRAII